LRLHRGLPSTRSHPPYTLYCDPNGDAPAAGSILFLRLSKQATLYQTRVQGEGLYMDSFPAYQYGMAVAKLEFT
jgi:hypothetical protein